MTDSFDLPLRTKIAAGLLTAILVLIVGAISFWAMSRAAESAAEVEHTSEVLLEQQKLLAGLADAETAARGYTLTAQDSFLLPLEAAKVRVPASIARLRTLTQDHRIQQIRLDTLESVARESLRLNEQIVSVRRNDGFEQARLLIATAQGKQVMDHARDLSQNMKEEE